MRVIIKVKGHPVISRWLEAGNRTFEKWLAWWLPGE